MNEDPDMFEEMLAKKKWTYASKDPNRAIKQMQLNNHFWNLLNDLPNKTIKAIVTPKILNMDKQSCDSILNAFLKEKNAEDTKKLMMQKDRMINRNKMVARHNQSIESQKKLGVKIGVNKEDFQTKTNPFIQHEAIQFKSANRYKSERRSQPD